MDKNEPQVEQPGCGCDSSSGDEVCCSPSGGKKTWRTALFIMVLVLAGAVAAHSVYSNGDDVKPACCPAGQTNGDAGSNVAACPMEQANGDGVEAACSLGAKECSKEAAAGGCPLEAAADPAPQPAPTTLGGCCPSQAPADPAPQPAPTAPAGCCPGHGS